MGNGNGESVLNSTPNPSLEQVFNSVLGADPSGNIAAMSLKLPAFWTNLPVEWFLQVEALFSTRNITSQQTKFNYILAALPCDIITTVIDVIQANRDAADAYDKLKAALLGRLVKSESRRIEELLRGTPMGDRTPSEYYRHLRVLAGSSTAINDELLRNLWLRNLPALVQTSVTTSGKTEADEMVTVADKVFEVYERQASFTPLTATAGISELVAQNQQLVAEVAALKQSFARMQSSNRFPARSRSRDRRRSDAADSQDFHVQSRAENVDSNALCWYHAKYGDGARKCRPPCAKSNSRNPN